MEIFSLVVSNVCRIGDDDEDNDDQIIPFQPQDVLHRQGNEVVLRELRLREERFENNARELRDELREDFKQQLERENQRLIEERAKNTADCEELKEQIRTQKSEIQKLQEDHKIEISRVKLKNDEILLKLIAVFALGFTFGMMLKFSHLSIVIIFLALFIAYKVTGENNFLSVFQELIKNV